VLPPLMNLTRKLNWYNINEWIFIAFTRFCVVLVTNVSLKDRTFYVVNVADITQYILSTIYIILIFDVIICMVRIASNYNWWKICICKSCFQISILKNRVIVKMFMFKNGFKIHRIYSLWPYYWTHFLIDLTWVIKNDKYLFLLF